MIGRKLGHHQVLSLLGAGGMGEVYRARDEHLERDVAIKVLPPGTLGDEAARRRFRREALTLSQLNHPNIATIHDFDTQDGVDFVVLELIEGESLDERLARGPLESRELIALGVQLASGLEAAHAHGVIHRDLKPANLRITPDGRLKILDFGLARLFRAVPDQDTRTALTDAHQVIGTVPYMAPEQLAAEALDARCDLYAAGAVLYEMATGRRAFVQETPAQLMYAILNEAPRPPRELSPRVSPDLEHIVLKALEKDRELRYASARDMRIDLERLRAPSTVRPHARRAARAARVPVWAIASAAAAVALASVAVLDPFGWRGGGADSRDLASLAVLPLANLSGDPQQEYFADGMTEELITSLGKISALTVIARSSVIEYKGAHKSIQQIAHALKVGSVLEGTVLRAGDRVRVSVQLIRAASGKLVWSESYARSLSDVLALQSDVALAIAREIQVKLTSGEQERLAGARPVDPRAHEEFLLGRHEWDRLTSEGELAALEHYRRAIAIDPHYAGAYAGMADAYYVLNNYYFRPDSAMPLVRDAATRAIELDPSLADAHALLAQFHAFYEWDFARGEVEYRKAIDFNPSSSTARLLYGYFLTNMGRYAEARPQLARARELDPGSGWVRWIGTWPTFYERRYDQSIGELLEVARAIPEEWFPYSLLGEAYEQARDYPRAIETLRKARTLGGNPWVQAALARTFAEAGQRDSALRVLGDLDSLATHQYVSPYALATARAALGDHARALDLLDQAARERSEDVILMKIDPRMDALRREPRFIAWIAKLHYPGS